MQRQGFQENYSALVPEMLDPEQRSRKVRKLLAVVEAAGCVDNGVSTGVAIDVGCSMGLFASGLAPHFERVLGFDIDARALRLGAAAAPQNMSLILSDSQRLPLRDASVDLVLCNHVYEHVPDARELFADLYRVLKPGGVCYLGAASRLVVIEPHYGLPFLSWLPKPLAHRYMRWGGKGERYYENLRTLWGIKSLVKRFSVEDYTLRVIQEPDRFDARDLIPKGGWIERTPTFLLRALYCLMPTYILILRKPGASGQQSET